MGFLQTIEDFKMSKRFKYIFFGILCVLFPLVITIYGIVYFGGLWDPISRLNNLKVSFVNEDVGCPVTDNLLCLILSTQLPGDLNIGKMIVSKIQSHPQAKDLFDWQYNDNYTEPQCYEYVDNYDRWAVVHIPQNFTQNILSQIKRDQYNNETARNALLGQICQSLQIPQDQCLATLVSKYDVSKLLTSTKANIDYIYDTARSYTSVTFVTTALETIDKTLKQGIAEQLYTLGTLKGQSFNNEFYLDAYNSNFVDIHPLHKFGQNFATFMLYVIIYIAAIATNFVYRKYRPFNNYIQDKKTNTSIFISAISKICINMLYMLVACAFMMLVTFMFGGGQHENNLFCGYLIFVLWAFISLTFCHVVSNLLPLLPFLGVCVIFLVIQLATCGGIVAVPLQPGFWNIGKALPMYYATAEMKYILFDTGGRFSGRNILALLLWALGLAILDVITCVFQLRNVRNLAPQQTKDIEKQDMTHNNNNRVTQQDIENNSNDITNLH